jgi:hypothetical protein
MFEEGDDILTAVGVVLAAALVLGVAIMALAAATAPTRTNDAPDAQWRLERPGDTHVRIVHDGGESVPSDEVVVTVDGVRRTADWDGTLSEGDAVVVAAEDGQVVRVHWDAGEGNRELMARWEVG